MASALFDWKELHTNSEAVGLQKKSRARSAADQRRRELALHNANYNGQLIEKMAQCVHLGHDVVL